MIRRSSMLSAIIALCGVTMLQAQVTFTVAPLADTFVATGSVGNPAGSNLTGLNFGAAGMLAVAPATGPKGEFQSLLRFDLNGATNCFATNYGNGNWTITGVSLELTANYGTSNALPGNPMFPVVSGGNFVIEWLANDAWVEGTGTPNLPAAEGIDYDSLAGLLASDREILGTNPYAPPGDNVPVVWPLPLRPKLVADVTSGGEVTLRLYATDSPLGYLFNARQYGRGNEPLLHVTASPMVRLVSSQVAGSMLQLIGQGSPNTLWQLQASTNLSDPNWQTVAANTTDSAGWVQFADPITNVPQRFYRLVR